MYSKHWFDNMSVRIKEIKEIELSTIATGHVELKILQYDKSISAIQLLSLILDDMKADCGLLFTIDIVLPYLKVRVNP